MRRHQAAINHTCQGVQQRGELGRHSPLTLLKEEEKEAQRKEKEGMMEDTII
jgi:hypothetical protein